MNIFEYIDKKRNEYEALRDESQLQLKTNQNRIQKISFQIEHMAEEGENPSKFFLPETENYQKEIDELQEKINILKSENDVFLEKIRLCEEEICILDELELPDFTSSLENAAWQPMVVPKEEFQKKNVSRETIVVEAANDSSETLSAETATNVSRETFVKDSVTENLGEAAEEVENLELSSIKDKIRFCHQISQLDPRRCSLLLEEILNEI